MATASRPEMPSPRSNGDVDFAAELSARTRTHHKRSDHAVRLAAPFALSSPRAYRLLLLAFYRVYHALELELDERRRVVPRLSMLHFSALQRTRAFEADLIHYYGDAAAFRAALTQESPSGSATPRSRRCGAVDSYIETMRAASRNDPVLLIAYVHSLYLALLAGGQTLSRWLERAFGLTPPTGVAVFHFDAIADRAKFRRDFADAINSIPLSRAERDRIVQHKRLVFEGNDAIFREVVGSRAYRRVVAQIVAALLFVLAVALVAWRFWAQRDVVSA